MKRSCGILMAVSSLPSPYGIGTVGAAAREFVDFLAAAGQSWWQLLPVGPTGYGDSPYQSVSAYAGSPYLVDLDELCAAGLLTREEIASSFWGCDPARVDYQALYQNRLPLLRRAMERGWEREREAVEAFAAENAAWLDDYALFMALKQHFAMRPWNEWPEDIRLRRSEALAYWRAELAPDVRLFVYIQFLFFRQWDALRAYARDKGVFILGDLPLYVAFDSADVWAEPEAFCLDSRRVPTEVSGVPPDYFSADGQLWGTPLYNWDAMRANGYGWWRRRAQGAARLYDAVRIDHFRGLESYWAVPYGETTARNGRWVKGPGMELVAALKESAPALQFIAEDLGILTDEVRALLRESGLPGMKVLQFAFNPHDLSDYLPHNQPENCVCYAGTHDNNTLRGWLDEADPGEIAMAQEYLGLNDAEGYVRGILRGGMAGSAGLFMAQMQDWLALGAEARMNTPGTLGGNWQWRLRPGQLTPELSAHMARMTWLYGRLARA